MRRSFMAIALVAMCVPASAQEQAVAEWAPEWKVGDTWVVRTYLKDMSKEIASPKPAPGAMPQSEDLPQLPDFPPLRDGIPMGYKKGNRWKFEVKRMADVRHDDDEPGTEPERFWVLAVETLEGSARRSAELWYATSDLVLSKIVLHPGKKNEEVRWTKGTAQVALPSALSIGLPLDWPDLRAAKKPKAKVRGRSNRYEQRVRVLNKGTPKEEVRLKLTRETTKREKLDPAVRFVWRKGAPFWSRMLARDILGVLERP